MNTIQQRRDHGKVADTIDEETPSFTEGCNNEPSQAARLYVLPATALGKRASNNLR